MSLSTYLLGLTLVVAPVLGFAGGKAVIQGEDKTITVEFSGPLVRLQSKDQKNVQLIGRDDKVYAVTNMGGRPMVVESTAVMGLLGDQGLSKLENSQDAIQKFVSLTPTGAHETVAGLPGDVYKLVYADGKGQQRAQEIVLGRQPAVVELSQSLGDVAIDFLRLSKADVSGLKTLVAELDRRRLGLLRFGDKVKLASLDTATPDAARFALPAAPMQLPPGIEGMLKGMGKQ